MKINLIATVIALLSVSACATAPVLDEYSSVADAAGPAYQRDLAACRAIATAAEAEYRRKENAELGANLIAGILVGAVAGQAVGGNGDWTAYGAANGAAAGIAATDTELARGGPRRIIDRCLIGRGHRILSDIGRG